MSEERFQPFSCGTQGTDWVSANCERCKKFNYKNIDNTCDIDRALVEAFFDDGTVSMEIAKRMGAVENDGKFQWMCPEVEWTEEWEKQVYEKRRAE